MANRSKEKGDRFERQVVERFNQIPGVEARRTGLPIQASRPQETPGDVVAVIPSFPEGIRVECKSRSDNEGWKQLVKWLEGVDVLALKLEGSMLPLMVVPWDLFEELIRASIYNTGEPTEEKVDLLEGGEVGGTEFPDYGF
jgi:Holliday junction resolvase